ncbi:MAG: hypothetical protein J2P22_19155 [Nocardioides sp.]|nr:hypothetical protein [Nocardioides sp.]
MTFSSPGSRTAAYLVAGAIATIPGWFLLIAILGIYPGTGAVVFLWAAGVVWLLKKRQDDPSWDRRPTSGHR